VTDLSRRLKQIVWLWLPILVGMAGCGPSQPLAQPASNPGAVEELLPVEELPPPAGLPSPAAEAPPVDSASSSLPPQASTVDSNDSISGDGPVASTVRRQLKSGGEIVFSPQPDAAVAIGGSLKLTLSDTGAARVDYLGEQPGSSSGRFRIDPDDRLILDFGADDPWLPMPITIEDGRLLINAPDREAIRAAALEAGIPPDQITDSELESAFELWPLRSDRTESDRTESDRTDSSPPNPPRVPENP
jgi:hypothetical protein